MSEAPSGIRQSVFTGHLQWMLKNFPKDALTVSGKEGEAENSHRINLNTELKTRSVKRNIERGIRIQLEAVESSHHEYVVTALIRMYAKCGNMVDARCVFDSIEKPKLASWTALLTGYAQNRDWLATLDLFFRMKACGYAPDSLTYIAALKACTSLARKRNGGGQAECLKRGRYIHSEIGCHVNIFAQSMLIDMYSKCGSMVDARTVFDSIEQPDVVSWNALILGYAENGEGCLSLELFLVMKGCGYEPDSVTYVAAVKACSSLVGKRDGAAQGECLKLGREIHSEIGCELNFIVLNTLIDMYGKCGSMVEARLVFDSIQKPTVVAWTSLLLGYAENGDGLAGLELFSKMKTSGCAPDTVTYVAVLKACTSLARNNGQAECLQRGRKIHAEIAFYFNCFVQSTLIDMYGKCGSMEEARCVFDAVQMPNVVCWNALLSGYAENGDGLSTLELYSRMKSFGCMPDSVTYVTALKACGLTGALALGRKFHSKIREFTTNTVTCLVDFYAKCGSIVEACEVFDTHSKARDISTWTALLTGYSSFGDTVSVFSLFQEMQDQGLRADAVTFVCLLSCCSHAGLVDKAREYFEAMPMQYAVTPTVLHYTCMVDVLGRGNFLNEAITLIRKMPCKANEVTWMTLLSACRKWKNFEIGKSAFKSLVDLDKENVAAYVLMADIYSSRGMWEDQEQVLGARKQVEALLEQAYVYDELGNMVKFVIGKEDPPEVRSRSEELIEFLEKYGCTTKSSNKSFNVAEAEKDVVLCGHSERKAVVYGILRTAPGEPVRAFKNMRMCEDCHKSTKMISRVSGKVVIVRDSSRFHVMVDGRCSCGDYW